MGRAGAICGFWPLQIRRMTRRRQKGLLGCPADKISQRVLIGRHGTRGVMFTGSLIRGVKATDDSSLRLARFMKLLRVSTCGPPRVVWPLGDGGTAGGTAGFFGGVIGVKTGGRPGAAGG